jgi:hypothetical protein
VKLIYYFNVRTFLALVISQAAAFLVISYHIKFHLDLLLFGLCIVFPLNFSMQAAFRRRERALEYFSLLKAASMALHYSFQIEEDLPAEKKKRSIGLLNGMFSQLMHQLEHRIAGYKGLQQKLDELFSFIEINRNEISKRNMLRMIRYLTRYNRKFSVFVKPRKPPHDCRPSILQCVFHYHFSVDSGTYCVVPPGHNYSRLVYVYFSRHHKPDPGNPQ